MTQKHIEKLVKALTKNYKIIDFKTSKSTKEVQDFIVKHSCKIRINFSGMMLIETTTHEYKVEIYKKKMYIAKYCIGY